MHTPTLILASTPSTRSLIVLSDLLWSDPVEEKSFEEWQVYDLNRYRKIDFDANPGRNLYGIAAYRRPLIYF